MFGRFVAVALATACLATIPVPAGAAGGSLDTTEEAAVELLGFIPADVRASCEILTPSPNDDSPINAEAASIVVYLECETGDPDVDFNSYMRFSDADAMNRGFDGLAVSAGDLPRGPGDCPENTTWSVDGTTVGRVTCFITDAGDATRVWTHDDELILGTAKSVDADAEPLLEWWKTESGPLQEPEDVEGLADHSRRAVRAAEKRLRRQIPADQRRDCEPIDVDDPDATSDTLHPHREHLYHQRLLVRAAFDCDSARGTDSLTYWSVDPANVDAFFLHYKIGSAAPEGEDCPGDATWSVDGDEVGEYACFADEESRYPTDKTDAFVSVDVVRIVWTHRAKGFFGEAENDTTEYDDLFRFWNQDGGPA